MRAITSSHSRPPLWTKEKITALSTPDVKQLRANAERLNSPEVIELCNSVLSERPRSGVRAKPKKKAVTQKAAAPQAGETA